MSLHSGIKGRLRRYSQSDNRNLVVTPVTPVCVEDQKGNKVLSVPEPRASLQKYKYTPNLETTPETQHQSTVITQKMEKTEVEKLPSHGDLSTKQWWDMFVKMNSTLLEVKTQLGDLQGKDSTELISEKKSLCQRINLLEESMSKMETRSNIMVNIIIAQEKEIKELREELTRGEKIKKCKKSPNFWTGTRKGRNSGTFEK